MRKFRIFLVACLWAHMYQPMAAPITDAQVPAYDVRVLIDVSGSMKQNDPANLRGPALKLLANLLPPDSQGGVWIFAEKTAELAPLAPIDNDWKQQATQVASKIHSKGLFTNIESALESATENWEIPAPNTKRSLILLTDGVVDVSKKPGTSEASRERIVSSLLPEIQQWGAEILTIALSENADRELLEKLAFDTDGWHESVTSAEQLQRIFLKMSNKAAPRDSVPLKGNKFTVDESVNEFSALVFRKPHSKPTRLIGPDQTPIVGDNPPQNVRWQHEQGYDLITVEQPTAGEWRLAADVDPANQVMIVTDLKLDVPQLPNFAAADQPLEVVASFTEKGNQINRDDFLDLIRVSLKQTDDLGRERVWNMTRNHAEFRQAVADTLTAGTQTFELIADGKTFQREFSHTMNIVENPVKVDISADATSVPGRVLITLEPDESILDPDSVEISATLLTAPEASESLTPVEGYDGWQFAIDKPQENTRLVINIKASGKTLTGESIEPRMAPVVIDDKLIDRLFALPEEAAIDIEPEEEITEEPDPSQKPDWVMTGLITAGINLLLVGGGFLGYRKYKKSAEQRIEQIVGRLAT